jgi:hypothetical protein
VGGNGSGNEGGVGWIQHSNISYVCGATFPVHKTMFMCTLHLAYDTVR